MREIYEKNKKKIIICVVILIIVLLIWLIVLKPFLTFKQNEKTMMEAAKRYYEINNSALPTGKRISTVTLQKLYDKDLISKDLTTSYTSKLCDAKKSWVKVKKEDNDYKYYAYLKCGIYSSNIDHEGPIITLKGTDTVTINKGDSWTDPGVSSVIDNTDGNIDIKEVKVKSNVNTNKNGTYTITYKIRDSFKNETIKTRTVKVIQILDQIVSKDTKKTDGYYKANSTNNYVQVDGILFKIIGLNDDGTVRAVSDENLGYVDEDSVDAWLEEKFYNKLSDNAKEYIVKEKYCNEKITNPESFTTCKKFTSKKYVGLISVSDLNNTKVDDQYIFGGSDIHNLLTGNRYYLNSNDKITKSDSKSLYGVRAVINLKKDIKLSSGSGTESSPYNIPGQKSSNAGTKVNELKIGEYVTYSGYTWRVAGKEDDGTTQIVMSGILNDENDEYVVTAFDSEKNYYNSTKKTNIGYKITNTYSGYLSTKYFSNHKYEIVKYTSTPKYINKLSKNKIKAKLAETSIFDLFPNESDGYNYWYRESTKKTGYLNYSLSGVGENKFTETSCIRLTGYLSANVNIKSGSGDYDNPYKLAK